LAFFSPMASNSNWTNVPVASCNKAWSIRTPFPDLQSFHHVKDAIINFGWRLILTCFFVLDTYNLSVVVLRLISYQVIRLTFCILFLFKRFFWRLPK
jgi:hypothetical protein